ncbi:MAG: Do family serine endopeptidase [Bacteroidales bacterium]|jgi:Do/DeqQ family serine protease|nr:Do family serine endopeptidase [Bacteroidales bacterium]
MKLKNLIITLLIGMISGVLGAFIYSKIQSLSSNPKHELISDYLKNKENYSVHKVADSENQPNLLPDFTYSAEIGLPTVVHVKTAYNQPNYTLYDFMFGTSPRSSIPVMSSGSGVIISSDGYIVTNNHVIENAETIEVVLSDKRSYQAKLISRDPATDIALLKIDEKNLPCIKYGNSDDLKIGEWVLAIGNPFNLTSTATAGIVSAKARNININSENIAIESFIQTDAAVNPGNSGGALINTRGELVGINTAIASRNGSFVGYSFAIPVNIVRKIVADLVEFGEVQRGFLGVECADIDAELAKKFNINKIEGVYVSKVYESSTGQIAGLKEGDIILKINNFNINSNSEFLEHLSQFRPGDEINISIKRKDVEKNLKATMQNKYGQTSIVKTQSIELLGAKFESLNDYEKSKLKLRSGLIVKEINSGKIAAIGIKKDFIILKVNDTTIYSLDDLKKIIENTNGTIFIEGMYPNGTTAYYSFRL